MARAGRRIGASSSATSRRRRPLACSCSASESSSAASCAGRRRLARTPGAARPAAARRRGPARRSRSGPRATGHARPCCSRTRRTTGNWPVMPGSAGATAAACWSRLRNGRRSSSASNTCRVITWISPLARSSNTHLVRTQGVRNAGHRRQQRRAVDRRGGSALPKSIWKSIRAQSPNRRRAGARIRRPRARYPSARRSRRRGPRPARVPAPGCARRRPCSCGPRGRSADRRFPRRRRTARRARSPRPADRLGARAQGEEVQRRIGQRRIDPGGARVGGQGLDRGRRGVQRPDRRLEQQLVREQAHRAEVPAEQRLELGAIQLAHVVLVAVSARVGIGLLVRRGKQQHAARRQQAREARHQCLVGLDVLEGLERNDEVERGVGQHMQRGCVGLLVAQVRSPGVARAGMRHRRVGDVHAQHAGGDVGQQRGTVALAAGGIEHPAPARKTARPRIAVPVFVPDLAHALGREAFTGEFQGLAHDTVPARAPVSCAARAARRGASGSRAMKSATSAL